MDTRVTILTVGLFAGLFAGVLAIRERIRNPNPKPHNPNRMGLMFKDQESMQRMRQEHRKITFVSALAAIFIMLALHYFGYV